MGKMVTEKAGRTRRQIELFLVLFSFWVLLSASLSPVSLIVGAVVALIIAALSRQGMSFLSDFRLTLPALIATIRYFLYFFTELVKANFTLARVVLSPSLPINPGFSKARTRLKTPMARMLLANSITLTPGTLTVELEGEWLYVHWVNVVSDDVDDATRKIVQGFEKHLGVMYG